MSRPRAPAWATTLARSISAIRPDPTTERAFRTNKNLDAALVPETLAHFLPLLSLSSSPLSPLSTSSLLSATATESERSESDDGGAAMALSPSPLPVRVLLSLFPCSAGAAAAVSVTGAVRPVRSLEWKRG